MFEIILNLFIHLIHSLFSNAEKGFRYSITFFFYACSFFLFLFNKYKPNGDDNSSWTSSGFYLISSSNAAVASLSCNILLWSIIDFKLSFSSSFGSLDGY